MSEEAIQDTGSQEVATDAVAAGAAPVGFLDSLPEDLRGEPSLRTFTDPVSLAKSYVNAQRLIGADKVAKPSKSWSDDQYNDFYNAIGRPEDPKAYKLEINGADDGELEGFRQAMWEAGLQPRQAEKIARFISDMGEQATSGSQERAEAAVYQAEQELRQEFGQAFEQRMALAQSAARTLLGPDGMDMFENVQLSDGRMLGDHPDVVRMFANLAEQIGEDSLLGEPTELVMTPEEAKTRISEMTRRDGPYFDKMHPEHSAYVEEVLRLREFL
jgi:hypothetical protein